jgi:hypothetical protein
MNRREACKGILASLVTIPSFESRVVSSLPQSVDRLFPTDLPLQKPVEFPAAGFHQHACGVIYNQIRAPRQGMALGAIDTGYLSLEVDGTFGFCTAFNSIDPQRGPLALPLLGMSLGDQVWVLSSPRATSGEYVWIPGRNIQTPSVVHYWGHYPIADLEYDMPGCPVSVGVRAWAPFLPGDSATSNTPGAVFELHLRNLSGAPQQGRLALNVPGPNSGRGPDFYAQPAREKDEASPSVDRNSTYPDSSTAAAGAGRVLGPAREVRSR